MLSGKMVNVTMTKVNTLIAGSAVPVKSIREVTITLLTGDDNPTDPQAPADKTDKPKS